MKASDDQIIAEDSLRARVRAAYSAAAAAPHATHPFPLGADFARALGYSNAVIERVPDESLAVFSGVSNVSMFAPLREGQCVLDVGCGAGLDSIIAAQRTGPTGFLIGIDFSVAMLERARRSAESLQLHELALVCASAERIPVPDSLVDIALVNGIFNLNPRRADIFSELARVVRRGGSVAGAELVLAGSLPAEFSSGDANWFS